jgi:hypothetical protein
MEDEQKIEVLYAENRIKFPQFIKHSWMIFSRDKLMAMTVQELYCSADSITRMSMHFELLSNHIIQANTVYGMLTSIFFFWVGLFPISPFAISPPLTNSIQTSRQTLTQTIEWGRAKWEDTFLFVPQESGRRP